MAEERVQRRLAAILAADVVGYSRMMGLDEGGTLSRLKTLRQEIFEPKTKQYGGRTFKTTGDGALVEFNSAVDAVKSAVDIQEALAARNAGADDDQKILLRIGISLGDVIVEGSDLYGNSVNVASRMEGLAEPGGICVSGNVHEHIGRSLDVIFEDMGDQSVKNIVQPVRCYRVLLEPGKTDTSPDQDTAPALPDRLAVAVLPFENLSGDAEQEYFADGLTEDIITALSIWRSFPVIARNSTFAYKGQSPDIREVGKALGARYVLEGSVRKAASRVRVTAQLIDAETGHHVWAERYDRELEDIFALQDELTQGIAAVVAPEIDRAEHKRLVVTKPQNLGAWDLVLQGTKLLDDFSEASNRNARDSFERAVALDPDYSRAYAGLAFTYHRDIMLGFGASRKESLASLLENARRAVQLDNADYLGHWELAIGYLMAEEHDLGFSEALRSLELNPTNAHGYTLCGLANLLVGRADDAIDFIQTGVRLNPQDTRLQMTVAYMGRAHFTARRYDQAREWTLKAIARNPDIPEFHLVLAATLGHLGETERAQDSLEACKSLRPTYLAEFANWFWYKHDADNEHFRDGLRKAGWDG
ncbi:MAG: tetratricopeptide repeat protein [Rhodospirillaceae bacterium]|nr:tetratricopeptide repeat protein [Rhodospirillaceae bacterium]MBT5458752.1 tetratricopeptide repeat protein [Rhodospirillaceae bacterium]MBT7361069.1 tetratricopeptide repeat protein [Rhodospirillaceae bacterium]